MASLSGGILQIDGGAGGTIDFYDPSGYMVMEGGLSGTGTEHLRYEEVASPDQVGARIGRRLLTNRVVRLSLNLAATNADDMERKLRLLSYTLDQAAIAAISGTGQGCNLSYRLHGGSQTSVAKVLSGTVRLPANYASGATAPAMQLSNIQVEITTEPYWVDATPTWLHNIMPDPLPFGKRGPNPNSDYTPNGTGTFILTTDNLAPGGWAMFDIIPVFTGTSSWYAPIYNVAAASDGFLPPGNLQAYIYFRLIGSFPSPVAANVILLVDTGSGFVTVATNNFTYTQGDPYLKVMLSYANSSTIQRVRLASGVTGPSTTYSIALCGYTIQHDSVYPLQPTTDTSVISCTKLSNGEDMTGAASTAPVISRMLAHVDAGLARVASDVPAKTQIWAKAGAGFANFKGLILAARTKPYYPWGRFEVDQREAGGVFAYGSSTTVDTSITGVWGNQANSLKIGVGVAVATPTQIAWFNAANFAAAGALPSTSAGRWAIFAVIRDRGLLSASRSQGRWDWWLEGGYSNTVTSRLTATTSLISCAPTPAYETQLLYLGTVDLVPRNTGAAGDWVISLMGQNSRGAAGDLSWLDSLLLMPADEAITMVAGGTLAPTMAAGDHIAYLPSEQPSYAFKTEGTRTRMQYPFAVVGDKLELQPGKPTVIHQQLLGDYNGWVLGVTASYGISIQRRYLVPKDS